MKLPRTDSRKYLILQAFLRSGPMSFDDLIAEHGMFGGTRHNLRSTCSDLVQEYLLQIEGGIYSLPRVVRIQLDDQCRIMDNMNRQLGMAEPRVRPFKPLDLSRLHDRSMRRKSTLDRVNAVMHTVGSDAGRGWR